MSVAAGYRPCGQCGQYVPGASGCMHWRPYLAKYQQKDPGTVGTLLNRRHREVARQRATQAVAEFRRMMTRGVTG